jgi:integrase
MAKKQKFLAEDPGEDVTMPQTKSAERPVITRAQILALIGAIEDVHDLCLLHIGIFCGPRASEVMDLQWKSWTGESLMPHGTAYEGKFSPGRLNTQQSNAPIPVPELVRPVIEAWRKLCPHTSPEALIFPTFGRGKPTVSCGVIQASLTWRLRTNHIHNRCWSIAREKAGFIKARSPLLPDLRQEQDWILITIDRIPPRHFVNSSRCGPAS